MYEEGLQIPMLKILRAGEPNRDVLEIIRTNVRQPDETIGDIYAQISSNEVGADRLRSLLDEFELPDVEEIADEIISRSERAMRAGIAALPDGRLHERGAGPTASTSRSCCAAPSPSRATR